MNMGRVFQRTVDRYPNRTAIVDQDEGIEYSYKAWENRVDRLASALKKMGIGPGNRVGVVMQPRVQVGTVYWAVQKCGAAFVPYNIRVAADELQFLVNNTEPDLLVYSSIAREAVDGAHEAFSSTDELVYVDDNVPSYAESFEDFLPADAESVEPATVDPDDTSLILHTSGTTGRPKGVPRSHTNTYTAAKAHVIQSQWVDDETTLGLMPIYHTMGIRTLVSAAIVSGTWVAQRAFSPDQTVELIESEEITSLYLVPTVYHDLVKSSAIDGADVSSVTCLGYAGTSMTAPIQEEVRETFDPEIFVNHYGSTEVYTHSICSWIDSKPGSAGRAGINTRIRVVNSSRDGTVPPNDTVEQGELGEIVVDATSPEAFDGYLNRPEATEQSFEDGWYFTGDLGYRDDDGDIFVVGRVDDMIISGGENIYPVEVENVLDGHKAIDEVAVVGIDDERWNQIVTAFVTLPDGPKSVDLSSLADRLDTFCRESDDLADFKRPRKYVFVDEIVKSNVGKVLRRELEIDDLDVEVYEIVNV
ncbi:AMP-binding protein [Natrinema versiforme]|uniref:Long-chain fatty acid--CoA ligase n=1 Tax=Natrinema versiforme TaxID=88724 RepID=A0A4P8WM29_9EURY|nr:AMP-binding protein [Natrinema versiforme]QCS44550.1 long-chain fatty acid--CoA ligase [Natrinema versiforme]